MSLLEDALALVSVESPSFAEAELVGLVEGWLAEMPHLDVQRIGDNLVAESRPGVTPRYLLVGHSDTVPLPSGHEPRIAGDVLHGCGAADMKGSLAVFLGLMRDAEQTPFGLTFVLYAREEVARKDSGLTEVLAARPDLTKATLAVVGEPTTGTVEAGCQGSVRVRVDLAGVRAHSARPFMGVNAAHRAAPLLAKVAAYEPREVDVEGLNFVEQLQVVGIEGGISGNVVPDRCSVLVNFRYAPDRSQADAEAWLQAYLGGLLERGDRYEIEDHAPAARPFLDLPEVAGLVALTGAAPHPKVGWTDVATLAAAGCPAVNLGAGDPLLAHHPDEAVTAGQLEALDGILRRLLNP